jgi:glycosyltransferase involved in cell wall biosynthesis
MISIIIPVYNEEKTILRVIDSVEQAFQNITCEIIVVNDGSTDKTHELCDARSGILYIALPQNHGKGFALRNGFINAKGEFTAIQDADLEYHPEILRKLFEETKKGEVVYGKRDRKQGYFLNKLGNALLSAICNMLYGSNLFDIYTCYKIIPTDILQSLELNSNGFEIEAEITAKLLRRKIPIKEIPITYTPRTFQDGKHIRAKDAFIGIWTLVKNKF